MNTEIKKDYIQLLSTHTGCTVQYARPTMNRPLLRLPRNVSKFNLSPLQY